MKYRNVLTDWRLVAFVALVSSVLVFGRHFDALFAGGDGFIPIASVVTEIDERTIDVACSAVDVTRENILTCSGERKKITFGSSTIWMDENTQLVVSGRKEGFEALTFYGGRIVVEGPVNLHVRDLVYQTSGRASFVNYSWLSKLDVYAIDGDVTDTEILVASGNAVRFDTLAPYDEHEEISSNYQESSAAAFYSWVESH